MQLHFYKKNKQSPLRNRAVLLTVIVSAVLLAAHFFSKSVVSFAGNLLTPVYSYTSDVINRFSDFKTYLKSANYYKNEILRLESEISELEYSLLSVSDYAEKISRLESILGLKNQLGNAGKPSLCARVVSRSVSRLVIDKGYGHGVSVGDGVTSCGGIVGRISETYANHSVIEPVFSRNITLYARNVRNDSLCQLQGDGYKMISQCRESAIRSDDIFEISGDFAGLPDGTLIGKAGDVFEKDGMLYANITPFEDISQLKEVIIVIDK